MGLSGGEHGIVSFLLGEGRQRCELSGSAAGGRFGPIDYRSRQPVVVITGQVPRDARTLSWTLHMRCSTGPPNASRTSTATVRLHIRGHRGGSPELFSPGSVRIRSYPADASTAPEPVEGGKGGYSCASSWDGFKSVLDASTYCTGYCTWFVWQKRPEQQLRNLGNASEWFDRARARGIPVGSTPLVGAIAWWGVSAHAKEGHVAYVTGVGPSGVTIVEMNHTSWDVEDTRTLVGSELPNGYIYGGPAGSGPGAPGAPGASPAPAAPESPQSGNPQQGFPAPAAMYDGTEEAYFRGANGDLTEFAWGAPTPLDLGHQMVGSPSVFYDTANGEEEIYYEGANGDLDMSWWKEGTLHFLDLGVQATGSPAAMYDGTEEAYFRGANGDLTEFAWGAPTPLDLGHQMVGSPSVFYDTANGEEEIYYEGANGDLDMSWWKEGTLNFLDLGKQIRSGPAAFFDPANGLEETYFAGPNGNLTEGYWGNGYQFLDLGAAF